MPGGTKEKIMKNYSSASAGNYALEKALNELSLQMELGMVGNVYVVATTTEPNLVSLYQKNKFYADGTSMVQPTVAAAYACAVTNRNDVIFISANGTSNKVTEILPVAKNRVHFIGLDPVGRKIGARALISNTGAGAATDTAMVKITGTGCSFRNLSFKNNWTVTENLSSVCDWGIQTYWENCDIESLGSAHLTNASAASLILGGNECIYKNCTVGQDSLLVTSTAGQQLLIQNRGTTATKSTRCRFDGCRLQTYTSDTTHVLVRAGATSIDRDCTFESCEFANASLPTSGVTLAVAIATDAGVAGGIYVGYPRAYGITNLATQGVGNTGILMVAPVNAASDAGAIAPTS